MKYVIIYDDVFVSKMSKKVAIDTITEDYGSMDDFVTRFNEVSLGLSNRDGFILEKTLNYEDDTLTGSLRYVPRTKN